MTLDELRAALDALAATEGLARVRRARALSDDAMAALAAVGDEGVWQVTRPRGTASRAEVAAELGVSVAAVGKAITRHNRALTVRTESDKPKRAPRKKRT